MEFMKKVLIYFFAALLTGINPAIAQNDPVPEEINPALPTIAVITAGGPLSSKKSPKPGAAAELTAAEIQTALPKITKLTNIKVVNFFNLEGSCMTPKKWLELSRYVDNTLKDPKISGAIVVHGIDTITDGAFLLDLTLTVNKPVVFTGAMKEVDDPGFDGYSNLYNAILQINASNTHNWGVTVTMNQYIYSARDVYRNNTSNIQSFSSDKGYLGYFENGKVFRLNDCIRRQRFSCPDTALPEVPILVFYPGADGSMLRSLLENDNIRGVVIQASGTGNLNPLYFEAVKAAIAKGVSVIIAKDVINGRTQAGGLGTYGGAALEKEGAIFAGDLSASKARIVLMFALSQSKSASEIKGFFR